MKCISCDGDNIIVVLMEIFPCKHCNGEIEIKYVVCEDCGMGWKTVDDEILSGTTFFDMGLGDIFENDEDETTLSMAPVIDHNENKSYMGDYIHKCLRCQAWAYEAEENLYKCPSCDFEWEVIKNV